MTRFRRVFRTKAWLFENMAYLRLIGIAMIVLALGITSFIRTDVFIDDMALWTDAISKSPNIARPKNNLARALMVAGKYQRALPFVEQALLIDPEYADARYNLAIIYYVMGLPADAEREFTRIIERHPLSNKADHSRSMVALIRRTRQRSAD